RITAIVLRSLSIAVLLALTWRVSSPQSETIWTAYETPGDLVRLILGLAVCLWLVVHLFILPRDPSGYRTWLYLRFIVLPLGLILTIAIWCRGSLPVTLTSPRACPVGEAADIDARGCEAPTIAGL